MSLKRWLTTARAPDHLGINARAWLKTKVLKASYADECFHLAIDAKCDVLKHTLFAFARAKAAA